MFGNVTKDETRAISEQSQQTTKDGRHFMNYCFIHAGKFSCAVDCFLELTFAVFKDFLNCIERIRVFSKIIRGSFSIRCYAFLPTNGEEHVTSLRTSAWEARYTVVTKSCNIFFPHINVNLSQQDKYLPSKGYIFTL